MCVLAQGNGRILCLSLYFDVGPVLHNLSTHASLALGYPRMSEFPFASRNKQTSRYVQIYKSIFRSDAAKH